MSTPIKILLVDDNPANRAEFQVLMAPLAEIYDLTIVDSFDQAIPELAQNTYDAYLLSRELSDNGGLELVMEISDRHLKGAILLLTGTDNPQEEVETLQIGSTIHLHRDQFTGRFLDRMIRQAVERKIHEVKIRRTQEEMTKRMMDLQDTSERFEAQSAEYVQMAEDLAFTQAELKSALKDVTESKQELEKLNQQKDRFFSIISHDLRSPFTSLLGYTGMIAMAADKMPQEKLIESAQTINDSALRVFALLENLLEWAQVQMNKVESHPVELNMKRLVGKTVDVLEPVGADKNVAVLNAVEENTIAYADFQMIDTVIRNLTNNAIKFTPEGGSVTIAGRNTTDLCEIQVSDTGVGMSPEQIGKLFNLGEKNTTMGTGGEPGTGLGLLLCKDLLEINNGAISVDSKPGQGSTFTFTLPVKHPTG